jgi:hypothetical protein
MTDDRVTISVRLDPQTHRAAKLRMVDDDASFQWLFEAAVQAYINGRVDPTRDEVKKD